MSKIAWTISRMSRRILRSGKPSRKRDYDISNDEKAVTRLHDVGTWTGLARARCSMGQEERCHHGFSCSSTPARVWTQRTIPRETCRGPDPVPHQNPAFADV